MIDDVFAKRLDEARLAARMTRAALSAKTGISEPMIVAMCRGARRISPESAKALAPVLDIVPEYLLDRAAARHSKPGALSGVVAAVLDIVSMDTIRLPAIGATVRAPSASKFATPTMSLPDLGVVHEAICHLFIQARDTDEPVRAYLEGRQVATEQASDLNPDLLAAMDYLLTAGLAGKQPRLSMVLGLGGAPEQSLRWALWVLKLSIRYALFERERTANLTDDRGLMEISVVKGISPRYPRDLWFSSKGMVDAFPRFQDEHIEQGIYVQGPCEAYRGYWEIINRSASNERIEVFTPDRAIEVWSRLNDKAYAGQVRLVQPFFTVATRPVGDFSQPDVKISHGAPLSGWLRRQLLARGYQTSRDKDALAKVVKLAGYLERTVTDFVDHSERGSFFQVFDKKTVFEWARSGRRVDAGTDPAAVASDSPAERLARIDLIIDYLARIKTFHLLPVDDLAAETSLTKRVDGTGHVISWMTNTSGSLVIVGTTKALPSETKPPSWAKYESFGESGVTTFVPIKIITDSFNAAFDELLARRTIDEWRAEAFEFLRNVRAMIPGALGR